jgi:hypothetical protein
MKAWAPVSVQSTYGIRRDDRNDQMILFHNSTHQGLALYRDRSDGFQADLTVTLVRAADTRMTFRSIRTAGRLKQQTPIACYATATDATGAR